MNELNLEQMLSAERIALPKGSNNESFRQDFTNFTGIEIPLADNGALSAKSAGRTMYWLRSIDIAEKVDMGLVDIGVVGSDVLLDYERYENLRVTAIGESVCRFSILTTPEDVDDFNAIFRRERRFAVPLVWLPTSRPRALERVAKWNDFPLRACGLSISGSVEAYAEILPQRKAVADLVNTGRQAAANGLAEAKVLFKVSANVISKGEKKDLATLR